MKKEELLRNYFLDALSPKELSEFESLLEKDPEFSEQFEFEKSVKKVIKAKKRKDLKSKIQALEDEVETSTSSNVKSFPWKPLRIAASIAVLIALGVYTFNRFQKNGIDQLYADHYDKYPNTVFPIKRGNDAELTLEFKAFSAYEKDDDQKAIDLFKELKATQQNSNYVGFYLAQSYLKAGQIENAIITFNEVIASKSKFTDESRWYLALAYLKNKDPQKAIAVLEQITKQEGYKNKEAAKVLEAMD